MTWLEHHYQSERYAADAELAARRGNRDEAQRLYAQAAQAEADALQDLEPSKARTYGISAVSVVSLYFKAAQWHDAETMACRSLASQHLPDFASDQLRGLLQSIWSEQIRERAGVRFARSAVSAAIRARRPTSPTGPEREETINGVLRALHLDEDWIEVTAGTDHLQIDQVGETVDDVIGPMVNHPVAVDVVRDGRGKLHFRDIELDE